MIVFHLFTAIYVPICMYIWMREQGNLTFVINTVQVFNKTITAESISNFTPCQQSIIGPKTGHGNKGTCTTTDEPDF